MFTSGRKTLYSSLTEDELTPDNIKSLLTDITTYHDTNKKESLYLKQQYVGIQDILNKKKYTREEINNKAVENWTYAITEFVKSFILNEPIQYVQTTESVSEEITQLNKYMNYANKAFKDNDILEDIILTGRGYRYISPEDDVDEDVPFDLQNIESENCEVVYYSGIGHKQLLAFVDTRMVKEVTEHVITDLGEQDITKNVTYSLYTVYTRNKVYTFTTENGMLEYVKKDPIKENIFPEGHRIVEYYFNKSRFSLIEAVKPILDKLNYLESLDMDDMEQFVNALMVFTNANITDETIQQGKELGALLLKSDTNLPADVKLLQGRMKASDTQIFYQRLLNAALSIIAMPFANDNGTYGDTGIARMTGQGWTMADQRSNTLIASLVKSEREVLKYLLKICKEKASSGISTLRANDVEIRFKINKNANILEKTQALLNMKNAQIAPTVAIPTCKIFNDDQNAIKQSEDYYGEDFWKVQENGGTSVQDMQETDNEMQDAKETDKQKGV